MVFNATDPSVHSGPILVFTFDRSRCSCWTETRSVIVLVVSTKAGTTAFARFLADPPEKGGLGCRVALNLDGGPSTQLVVRLPALALSLPGGWGVPNALVVAPGKR